LYKIVIVKISKKQEKMSVFVIHSYDIGIRNLAFACLEFSGKDACTLHQWHNVDCAAVTGAQDADFNKTKIEVVVRLITQAWAVSLDILCPTEPWPTHIYIETQPVGGGFARGRGTGNIKMKVVSHCLQAFLITHWAAQARTFHKDPPCIQFISPQTKLTGIATLPVTITTKSKNSYVRAKQMSISACPVVLRMIGQEDRAAEFETLNEKKDDLADAFLQGYYAGMRCFYSKRKLRRATYVKKGLACRKNKRRRKEALALDEALLFQDL
jgi:hypothetical protein